MDRELSRYASLGVFRKQRKFPFKREPPGRVMTCIMRAIMRTRRCQRGWTRIVRMSTARFSS